MDGMVGIMKRVAEHEARRIFTTEMGVVTAVFPHADAGDADNYQCSVRLLHRSLPDGQGLELRRVPIATPYVGLVCTPNVGDLVLVTFVGGDVNAPVVTGRLYNDEDRPPVNQPDELLLQHKLPEGASFRIDKDGRIVLTSKDGKNTLTVDDESISLKNDKFSLTIDFEGEKISLVSDKDVEIKAANGALRIDAKEVEIKSGGDLKLLAKSGKCLVDAQEAEFKAASSGKMEASGGLTLKGATIDLN